MNHPKTDPMLKWLRVYAVILFVAAAAGLILLNWSEAHGATGKPGFQSGGAPATNPFLNAIEANAKKTPPPSKTISINPRGTETNRADVPEPKFQAGKVSVGGEAGSGVTASSQGIPFIPVDTQSAIGGNQIVTDFNYPDAEIVDIAKTLGKLTGKNFILEKGVKGRITIISNSPITVSDAWKAFLTALDINGFTVFESGKYVRIARQRDARDKQLKTFTGDYSPDTDAMIIRVFPLKYIEADEVARVFRSFLPPNSRVIPHAQTNTVIVTDTGSNIKKLEAMLSIMDIEGYDSGIEVIPVKFASAVEISKLIDALLPGQSNALPKSGPKPFGGGNFTARKTKEGGVVNNIIADERTNSLIVNANQKGIEQVRELIATLDKKQPATVGGGKLHVVYLQFADAEEIAKTLTNIESQNKSTAAPSSAGGRTRGNPTAATLFKGDIKVAADKATNSLVITAAPADFVTVQRVINKLDIPRDEVYIEAYIMEMTLGNDFNFSSNIASPTNGISLAPAGKDILDFITTPLASSGMVLGLSAGKKTNFTVNGTTYPVSNVIGLIKAIQTQSNTNILANPQILTLDNQEANFEITERIPVPTTTASNTSVVSSVTKEDVGLSLKIKPQINKISNFVKMTLKAKMEDIANKELPQEVATKAFATLNRQIETTVVVADGDTVVLGGLIRDKITDNHKKIPLLGDIPVLGWLFKSKEQQISKTNLLLFITPKIIRKYEKARAILDEKFQERDEFIREEASGEDPHQHYRNKIIRRLPDTEKILEETAKGKSMSTSTLSATPSNPQAEDENAEDLEQDEVEENF